MKFSLPKFSSKGGTKVEKKQMPISKKLSLNPTAVWVGATVVFAALFFLSAVLDMRVKVTFGDQTVGASTLSRTVTTPVSTQPVTNSPASGGIASQVGGC